MSSSIGSALVERGLITPEQLAQAKLAEQQSNGSIAAQLISRGLISEKSLAQITGQQYKVPIVQLDKYKLDTSVADLIPQNLAAKHSLVPVVKKNSDLLVAMLDPSNLDAIQELRFATGLNIKVVVALHDAIKSRQKDLLLFHLFDICE